MIFVNLEMAEKKGFFKYYEINRKKNKEIPFTKVFIPWNRFISWNSLHNYNYNYIIYNCRHFGSRSSIHSSSLVANCDVNSGQQQS